MTNITNSVSHINPSFKSKLNEFVKEECAEFAVKTQFRTFVFNVIK